MSHSQDCVDRYLSSVLCDITDGNFGEAQKSMYQVITYFEDAIYKSPWDTQSLPMLRLIYRELVFLTDMKHNVQREVESIKTFLNAQLKVESHEQKENSADKENS